MLAVIPIAHSHFFLSHSSSSAIFERDIEPIASPHPHSSDPHHIPRAKFTEELERAVPSVLDSAAAVLAATDAENDDFDAISILTPAPMDQHSGFTSPISRLSSRSPSPSGANRRSLLFSNSLPGSPPRPVQGSPPARPTVQTSTIPLSPVSVIAPISVPASTVTPTPTSAYFSAASEADSSSNTSSPTTATHTEHPLHSLVPPQQSITIPAPLSSHPPSPKNITKRLSFISYMDLLSSTPASAIPLSTLTSSAIVSEPPPHIPSVIGLPQAQYAASSSGGSIHGAPTYVLERDGAVGVVADDVGGEWEREGLGKGLEERLEELKTAVPSRA